MQTIANSTATAAPVLNAHYWVVSKRGQRREGDIYAFSDFSYAEKFRVDIHNFVGETYITLLNIKDLQMYCNDSNLDFRNYLTAIV